MEVVQILPSIIKDEDFKLTNPEQCKPPLNCRQGQSFKLGGNIEKRMYAFEVIFDNYYTNIDTDFILDIPTSCMCLFKTIDTAVPTVGNLYELYEKANHASGWAIVKEAMKRSLKADFLPQNAPLSKLEKSLKDLIETLFKG